MSVIIYGQIALADLTAYIYWTDSQDNVTLLSQEGV